MATINAVDVPLLGSTGSGRFAGNTSPSIATGLNDANGVAWIQQNAVGSAVNNILVGNAVTTQSPFIQGTGTDTNVILTLNGKGTGGAAIQGTKTDDNAAAGYVGEYVSASVLSGAPVALTTSTFTTVTQISLTAGDWDVWGNVTFLPQIGTTNYTLAIGWVSFITGSPVDPSLYTAIATATAGVIPIENFSVVAPIQRVSALGNVTYYLSVFTLFSAGTLSACGNISARRVR